MLVMQILQLMGPEVYPHYLNPSGFVTLIASPLITQQFGGTRILFSHSRTSCQILLGVNGRFNFLQSDIKPRLVIVFLTFFGEAYPNRCSTFPYLTTGNSTESGGP